MKRITISILIVIVVAMSLLGAMAYEEDTNTIDHQITITSKDDYVSINEILTIQGDTNDPYETLSVWIQSEAENIDILINTKEPDDTFELEAKKFIIEREQKKNS